MKHHQTEQNDQLRRQLKTQAQATAPQGAGYKALAAARSAAPADILDLQRAAGNRAVSDWVNRSSSNKLAPETSRTIQQSRGSGTSLPPMLRQEIENSLGSDFKDVRVHADRQADRLNQELGARAFTTGKDIYFRQGMFAPSTQQGKQTLRHELTHVVQQGGHTSSNLRLGPEHDVHEQEADRVAHQGAESASRTSAPAGSIQRWKWPWQRDRVKKLGGSLNTVYRVQHGRKGPVGYMKPNSAEDPGMGSRAVLSSTIDQLLGTNALSRETYTSLNGQEGTESSEVRGNTVTENLFEKEINKEHYDVFASMPGGGANVKAKGKGKDERYFAMSGVLHNTHDFKNPVTQRSMANIHLQDAITGQHDRHGGNIKIDPKTHEAKGYDNDLMTISGDPTTIPEERRYQLSRLEGLHYDKTKPITHEMRARKAAARQAAENMLNNPHDKQVALPSHIDQAAAEKLRDMKSSAFMAQLQTRDPANWARLNAQDPRALQELKERYKVIRRYAKRGLAGGPNGPKIVGVGGWNDQTYNEQLGANTTRVTGPGTEPIEGMAPTPPGGVYHSYTQRSVMDYNEVARAGGMIGNRTRVLDNPGAPALPTAPEQPASAPTPLGAFYPRVPRPTTPPPRPPVQAPTPIPPPRPAFLQPGAHYHKPLPPIPTNVGGNVRPVPPPRPAFLQPEAHYRKPLPALPTNRKPNRQDPLAY